MFKLTKRAFKNKLWLAVTLGVGTAAALLLPISVGAQNPPNAETYGVLPLSFEANRGQIDPQVKFLSRGSGYTLFLTRGAEAVLVLRKPTAKRDPLQPAALESMPATLNPDAAGPPAIVRMKLVGGNTSPRVEALDELPGKANYFIGNDPRKWHTNVPTYAKLRYREVYPGVDLLYYGNQQQLEHDFIVAPGADPRSITLNLAGAEKLSLDPQGTLVLGVKDGELRLDKPHIYQEVDGVQREIAGGYVLKNRHQVRFQLGSYDPSSPLVIDPVVFYSTYAGGSGGDAASGITVDSAGNAYVTGGTGSADFPTVTSAFQTTSGGDSDAFVTKLNPTGSGLVYSTYLGGSGADQSNGIAVDSAGNAYVTGSTVSTDFPTANPLQASCGGCLAPFYAANAFVAKLNTTGSALVYSTYLGGGGSVGAHGSGIAVDSIGDAYLVGTAGPGFPTVNPIPGACAGFCSYYGAAFVAMLNAAGSALVYSSYLGGSYTDQGTGIAVDSTGNAYVTGVTHSPDFPTVNPFQASCGGCIANTDTFVAKLNATGSALVYSTYLGGSGSDGGGGITVDSSGNAYVVGSTNSPDFPMTIGAFQTVFGGASDAFVTKLNPLGTGLVYSSYLGGSGDDSGAGIAVDASFNAYVTGQTSSTNFPTANPVQGANAGGIDAFATAVNPLGTGLVYSSYLGGSSSDSGAGIALDTLPNPNAYVAGTTSSTGFPTTSGACQTTYGGGASDAFITKIANITLPPGPTVGKVTGGGTINVSGGIANFGFIVQAQSTSGPISGDLQYVNHASGAKVHSVMFTTFTISGNTATFSGTCTNNSAPCTFTVTVQDNDQPPGPDSFVISIDGGAPEGGTLRDGDIEIH